MAALLRGEVNVEGDIDLLVLFQRLLPGPPRRAEAATRRQAHREEVMTDGLVQILDGNTFVVSERAATSRRRSTDPTGLFSFDTRFLSRWVLTVDGERLNPLSVDDLQYFETRFFLVPGTGTVYVDAKLSVIRQRAVGERLPRGADDPQPRREAGRTSPSASRPAATSPTCSRSRTRSRRRARTRRASRPAPAARLRARDVHARDADLGVGAGPGRRERADLHGPHRAARRVDDRPRRRHGIRRRRNLRPAEVRARSAARPAEHGAEPRDVARGRAPARVRLGRRSARRTGAASSTSPRCASRRRSPAGGACRPPACRGS